VADSHHIHRPGGDPSCAEQSPAVPVARRHGPDAASTSTRSWPASPAHSDARVTPAPSGPGTGWPSCSAAA